MINLKTLEKSKGVLLFAKNTDKTNYVDIADTTSQLIDKKLKLPITLVTDENSDPRFAYDSILRVSDEKLVNTRVDYTKNIVEWKNTGRYNAYQLSPYDETILLDVDYLVLTDNLLKLLDKTVDYQILNKCHSINGSIDTENALSKIQYIWATCVVFKKTTNTKILFDLIERIQKNYNYFRELYNIRETNFRNDYAFTVADQILNGYTKDKRTSIPWSLLTILDEIERFEIIDNNIILKNKDDKPIIISKQDMHILDKNFLSSKKFKTMLHQLI